MGCIKIRGSEVGMDLVVACNWDEQLVPIAARYGAAELFGKLHSDLVGGGRAGFILPSVTRKGAAQYIRDVQARGIAFNYLLNGTCLGNQEMTRKGQRDLRSLLNWLYGAGVRWFTVSIPYIASVIKKAFPDAHIVVSMMAGVESVETARYWEEQGAEVLIVFNTRDFALLRALKEHTGLKVEVAANLSCMNRCHQTSYHGNAASHASNKSGTGAYSLPVCETRCGFMKVSQPRRIVAGQWIRPEDVHVYEELGVNRLKILDRISPTEQLEKILDAYSKQRFCGNLAELIPGYRQDRVESYLSTARLPRLIAAYLKPQLYNIFKAPGFSRRNKTPGFTIDNQALDGFLEGFMKRDCRHLSCEKCGWCDRWADKAVHFEPGERQRYLADAGKNLDELESGSFFEYF